MIKKEENSKFVILDDILTGYNGDVNSEAEEEIVITVPDGIKVIGQKAFEGHKNIEKIILPSSVEEIDSYAFFHCTSLAEINLENVKYIGIAAFEACNLCDINIDSAEKICKLAFNGNHRLRNITIPKCANCIDIDAFGICYGLETVTVKCSKNAFINIKDTFNKANSQIAKAKIIFE